MTASAAEILAQYVGSLQDFTIYTTIDGNYDHIGATVADAILQANMRYATHVKPRINRILETYPEARTTTTVLGLVEELGAPTFLSWRGKDRAKRFLLVLRLFASEGVETDEELQIWLSIDANLTKLRAIKGIGPKTVDYFKILVGVSTSAIDRHLLNFLGLAGLSPSGYSEAQAIINETADILLVDRARFDHSIWQFMSKRVSRRGLAECDVRVVAHFRATTFYSFSRMLRFQASLCAVCRNLNYKK
jgi:hypothetical protein